MRILLTGGGTGGHTIPIVAVTQELKKRKKDLVLFWLGSGQPEEQVAKKNSIPFQKIVCGKFRRYFSFWNLADFFKIPIGIFQSFFLILGFQPDIVFSKGGYVSLPAVIAAWLARKKIIIHESDIVPGLANKIASRLANKILLGFKTRSLSGKYIFTGNPVAREILKGDPIKARKFFHLSKNKPVILVMGGSQGAQFINNLVHKSLGNLKQYQIIHLTGIKNTSSSGSIKKINNYHSYVYLNGAKMALAYSVADLVISRAGANSLAEIAARSLSSILIPLPSAASGHQAANADIFKKRGASIVLKQKDLSPQKFIKTIENLFQNELHRKRMGYRAKGLAKLNAADKIAQEVLKK